MNIENADVLIAIDRRGVAHVVKHRTASTANVKAEVKLTVTHTHTETFTSEEPSDTGLLRDPVEVAPAGPTLVRETLAICAEHGGVALITGTKVDGTVYTNRAVRPIDVQEEYVICTDNITGEGRTYRMDGIERASVAT